MCVWGGGSGVDENNLKPDKAMCVLIELMLF